MIGPYVRPTTFAGYVIGGRGDCAQQPSAVLLAAALALSSLLSALSRLLPLLAGVLPWVLTAALLLARSVLTTLLAALAGLLLLLARALAPCCWPGLSCPPCWPGFCWFGLFIIVLLRGSNPPEDNHRRDH